MAKKTSKRKTLNILDKNKKHSQFDYTEIFRHIRTNIEFSTVDKDIKSICITSSQAGEAKTTLSINLAYIFATKYNRVLLIDCDLRKPSVHKKFLIPNDKGLTDVLFDKQDLKEVIKKIENNLYVLPCGTIPPNPAEILGSKTMEEFLDELSINYDYIILDTPPVLAVTDAQLLAAKSDATVLVVKANKTKGKTVINSYKELEKVKANIIGTILNDYDNSGERLYYRHESDKKISKFLRKFKR